MKKRNSMKSMICTALFAILAIGCGSPKPEIETETETTLTIETDIVTETTMEGTESTETGQMTGTEQEIFSPYYLSDEFLRRTVNLVKTNSVENLLEQLGMDKNNPVYEYYYQRDYDSGKYYYIYENEGVFLLLYGVDPNYLTPLDAYFFLMPGAIFPEEILEGGQSHVYEMTYGDIPTRKPKDYFSLSYYDCLSYYTSSLREYGSWPTSDDEKKEAEAAIAEKNANSTSLDVQYTFWENGKVKERKSNFEPDVWGYTFKIDDCYDEQERPVFSQRQYYIINPLGHGEEFWIYEEEAPDYYFYVGDWGSAGQGIISTD